MDKQKRLRLKKHFMGNNKVEVSCVKEERYPNVSDYANPEDYLRAIDAYSSRKDVQARIRADDVEKINHGYVDIDCITEELAAELLSGSRGFYNEIFTETYGGTD